MSAGPFVLERYQATYANQVHPIRVQPETLALSLGGQDNAGSAAALTSPIGCRVTGSRRGIGLFARTVTVRLPLTGAPDGYQPGGRITLPVLTAALWNSIVRGDDITYLGVNCQVVGKGAEQVG